jgi:hypothetical protein
MAQRFYQKASVQVAIISGFVVLITAGVTIWHQRSELTRENKRLLVLSEDQKADVQRLETLLTPFRTIALEKFTGTEAEALQQLAERIKTVDAALAAANEKIESTRQELARKTADRTLTEEQRQHLKSSLIGVSGKVIVDADFGDSESHMFADQIRSALAETDLNIVEKAHTGVISLYAKGLFLMVMDVNDLPPHAEPIRKAFQGIGMDIQGGKSKSAKFPRDTVVVWVCHK